MYAVIRSGGKQYRVSEGDVVRVESLPGKVGGKVNFKEVLAIGENGEVKLGTPTLPKAKVAATIVAQDKHKKVRVFKFKKNSQYKILRGHRQRFTAVKVTGISAE
ncbi:50S ribosomal protein L21 [Acidobacteriia bacterium AH_259_A11_L15]|nr:50S ribosomal protein L21 [Acidobacteriia bacterium AH_259_A11_L15]